MKKLYVFTLLLLSLTCVSQSNTFKWVNNTHETAFASYDYRGNNMAVSPSGTNYYTGRFSGTIDFDRGLGIQELNSIGNFDIFISKYDENGEYIWAKQIGSVNDDYGFALTLDNSENIIVAGSSIGADFDLGPGVATLPASSYFIAKYDSSTAFNWVVSIDFIVYFIETDNNGNVYATGKNTFSKYDANGVLQWSHVLTNITGRSIATYPNGDVVLTGYFSGTVDFDQSAATFNLTASGSRDAFMVKYDGLGNFLWAFSTGGNSTSSGFDEASSVVIDSNGDICVVGMFATTVDFDPGPGVQNLSASFLSNKGAFYFAKYDLNGNYIFAYRLLQNMGNYFLDQSPKIAVDVNNNFYITGWHWGGNVGTVNNINLTSNGGPDIFIAKYNNSGADLWGFSIGAGSTDLPRTIQVDQNENIYLNGNFYPVLDFNPHASFTNDLTTGNYFFAKYGPCIDPDVPTLTATSTTICNGDSTVISIGQNDNLNDALVWSLYESGCGVGTPIAENDSGIFVVYPVSNITYSIRGESGSCTPSGVCRDITISVNPIYSFTETDVICSGGSYQFPDGSTQNNITSQVVYTSNLQTVNTCDSIIVTTLNVNPVYNLTETKSVCSGDSYQFPDGTTQSNITSQVVYTSNMQTVNTCDSIIITTVNVNPTYSATETQIVCSGDSYQFPDGTTQSNITAQVVYTSNMQTVNSCDSIIVTTLNVNPIYFYSSAIDICQGDSALVFGNYEMLDSLYTDSLTTALGCDSVYHIQLNVFLTYFATQNQTICSNDSLFVGGDWQNTPATYYDTLQTTLMGCDSVIETILTVNQISQIAIDTSFCSGTNILLGGVTYSQGGVFTQNYTNALNCDSIVTYNITENLLPNANVGPDTLWVCDGDDLAFGLDDTTGIVSYSISNFTITENNDSLLFTYDMMNPPSSVVSQVTDTNGCVSNDQVYIRNNNITLMQIGVPSFNDPFLGFTIANMPDNVDSWYWSFGDGDTLSGDVNPTHEYLSNGFFEACLVGENICGLDSSCMTFTIVSAVGIKENNINNNISIYPNPVKNQLTITSDNEKVNNIKIMDVTGKTLNVFAGNTTTINVSDLAKGLYFLQIQTEKGIAVKRFIKE